MRRRFDEKAPASYFVLIMEWIVLAGGILFLYACLFGIAHMLRLRKKGMQRSREYRDSQSRFVFRYPMEWTLEAKNNSISFITHDHDGAGQIEILQPASNLRESLLQRLEKQGITPDETQIHPFQIQGCDGVSLETRATRGTDRIYIQEWLINAGDYYFALSYQCSVLYGLVDGYYIDQLIRSIRFGETASSSKFFQPEWSAPSAGSSDKT